MLRETLLAWLACQQVVAIDTETDGLAWEAPVRLVQFGNTEGGFAVGVEDPVGRALVCEAVQQYSGQLVMHNAAFDIRRLEQVGVEPDYLWPRVVDTHVQSHVIQPDNLHGLKNLGVQKFGAEAKDETKALKAEAKARKVQWWNLPLFLLTQYGIKDTVLTARLNEWFGARLSRVERAVVAREMEVAWAMYEVQHRGMRLDVPYALELKERWETTRTADEAWFAEQGVANPNSNRQIAAALRDHGWQPEVFTPTGEVKLDKPVLAALAPDFELVARLIDYKRRGKWLAAYVENCLAERDSNDRVHAHYNPLGARTGRMSCSNPPLQQLPKGGGGEVRRLFIAGEGSVICSVDYSAIEMRLAGSFSEDPGLVAAYAEGRDVYQEMAEFIGCTRPQAKIASLAALYGSRGKSIARALGTTVEEAVEIVSRFWRACPRLSRWSKSVEQQSRRGSVTSGWGRNLAPHAPYAAGNALIQGTAAEVMKDGLLRLAEHGLLRHVVAVVHDEVVLDVPEAEAEAVTAEVSEVLADRNYLIPLVAEGEVYGRTWADGYGWEEHALAA